MGLAFGAYFQYAFFHKNVPYSILYPSDQVSFSSNQTKRVFKFFCKQLMTSETLEFIFDHFRQLWEGKDKNMEI